MEEACELQRVALFGLLVKVLCYDDKRLELLLPQVIVFLKTWIPQVAVPSMEMNALLYHTSAIIEAAFKLDFHYLSLFDLFLSLPKVSVEKIAQSLASLFYQVGVFKSCDVGGYNRF